jgi:hypothetical protein
MIAYIAYSCIFCAYLFERFASFRILARISRRLHGLGDPLERQPFRIIELGIFIRNQGIFIRNQGIFISNQGIFIRNQGILFLQFFPFSSLTSIRRH